MRAFLILVILMIILVGCISQNELSEMPEKIQMKEPATVMPVTPTPFLPLTSLSTLEPVKNLIVNIPNYWPLEDLIVMRGETINITTTQTDSDCQLSAEGFTKPAGEVVLSVVKQFTTTQDELTMEELRDLLNNDENGSHVRVLVEESIFQFAETKLSLEDGNLFQGSSDALIDFLYENKDHYAIIPFEMAVPAYKVMSLDGQSPYDQDFNSQIYPLSVPVGYACEQPEDQALLDSLIQPFISNRDPAKFTSVLMTGTTALTRAIGAKMELNGMNYPGELIKFWFDQADIAHVSNEVSFNVNCPPADQYQKDLLFCSRPEYAQLFSYMGVDIVELSGNHLADKGVPALENTFAILREQGIPYYAAGHNREEAEQAVRFGINGNNISFLGCNQAGPTFVWLTDTRSGVLACDMDRMAELVRAEVDAGYIPIVTFQYGESYQFEAFPYQKRDFRQMAAAGATIVSGSQAHLPMSMEIYQGAFIHYGLGNLFFDQMDIPVVGTRREFLDRHIFYDGKYLGEQLLTAMLEDYSQPRPMTKSERDSLLLDSFEYFQLVRGQ